MRIIVAEIETSIYSAIGSNLKFFGQEPIAGVCHNVQCVYLLLVNLGIDELVVICPLIMCHVAPLISEPAVPRLAPVPCDSIAGPNP